MEFPLISVILCTYNGEKYLPEQLDSLFAQTYPNLEFIISDDASKDKTVSIIRKYEDDPRIKLILHEVNLGYVKNFETSIQHATGDYISFCDQDDIWFPEKLQTLYENIGNYFLVYSDSLMIDEKGNSLHKKLSDTSKMYTGKDTRGFILWNVVWGHAMLIKRDLLEHCMPIPEGLTYDVWMAFVGATTTGIKYLDKVLTYYRQHPNNVTKTIYKEEGSKKSRTRKRRYEDYLRTLNWIKAVANQRTNHQKDFYEELLRLYKKKEKGQFVWPLFWFLVKHSHAMFRFRDKKLLSRIVEMRKQARGEHKH